ncbi:MAG: diaminopimelate epimerase [Flavobacteriia bacterium]|nr:diaminopimelate epimerase [Flavobacteriia bacterium]
MNFEFQKYQGTGNDFVVLDNRDARYSTITVDQIRQFCDRKMGVGSDGLILINPCMEADFEMVFYNPDASKSFCGNGARCAIAFVRDHNMDMHHQRFLAIDGMHAYRVEKDQLAVQMSDVQEVLPLDEFRGLVNTGSPHIVIKSQDISTPNVISLGQQIRYSETYVKEGVNVNLMWPIDQNSLAIGTYERGVENETLSCGTGATACALYYADSEGLNEGSIQVHTKGGMLTVDFRRSMGVFKHVWLKGPAVSVYSGNCTL